MKSLTTVITFKSLQIIFVVFLLVITVKSQNALRPGINTIINNNLDIDDPCVTVQNGETVTGGCTRIVECLSVNINVRSGIDNHTVCGYDGSIQVVCCPGFLSLYNNIECRISNSNAVGILKFMADCPELNESEVTVERNRICNSEICSDLVCCPVKLKHRLKKVCWNVDRPDEKLRLRLEYDSKPCTIKELNMTGRYQQQCDFAERNPNLKAVLTNVCPYKECFNWYCCPIEHGDTYYCPTINVAGNTFIVPVGPKCVDSRTGRQGTCRSYLGCYKATGDRSHIDDTTIQLDTCGFYCQEKFICCPDVDLTTIQSSANRECLSYTHFTREEIIVTLTATDNFKSSKISPAGGSKVLPGEFPHMAALGYEMNRQIMWNCGGSLISNKFVLTAAHCLSDQDFGSVKKVRLGVINLLISSMTADCPEEFDVAQIIPHPEYNRSFVYNDIGLVKLDGKVKFNFHIRPVCLPPNSDLPIQYISMGWGALGPGAEKTVRLIKVEQELFAYDECSELYSYNSNRRLNRGILNETQICAGSRNTIQSTCSGDSGGPLQGNHPIYPKLFTIYGIVSFGTVCGFANNSGIYTKVFPYVKWIEEVVWT